MAAKHWVMPMRIASTVWIFLRPLLLTMRPEASLWRWTSFTRLLAAIPAKSSALVASSARPSTKMSESEPSISERPLKSRPVPGMGTNRKNRGSRPITSIKSRRRSWFISLHLKLRWAMSTHREPNSFISLQISWR